MSEDTQISEDLADFWALHKQHLDLVLALTRANGDLLKARQRASGIEVDVMTAERRHAGQAQSVDGDASLDKMYALDKAAKWDLATAETHIEELECCLSEIIRKMAQPESD